MSHSDIWNLKLASVKLVVFKSSDGRWWSSYADDLIMVTVIPIRTFDHTIWTFEHYKFNWRELVITEVGEKHFEKIQDLPEQQVSIPQQYVSFAKSDILGHLKA